MSNSGLLSIARSALLSQQAALQVISQNIANAQTPGYSRQEAVLQATPPVRFSYGSIGSGVTVATVVRKRDILLDDSFRSANGLASGSEMRRDLVGQLESVFGEPSDAGLSNALDQFWGGWSDLATSPNSGAAKAVLQQRGRQAASLFNQFDSQLTQARSSTLDRVSNTIATINQTALQISDLNGRIVTSEGDGHTANDLRDERDLKIDTLSKLAGVRVIDQIDGSVSVIIGNSTLVDGITARPLTSQLVPPVLMPAVTPSDIPIKVTLGTSQDALSPLGGELKSLLDFINNDVAGARNRLDALAAQLVSGVNAEHVQGFVFNGAAIPGTAAGNFFDAGTTANPVRASTIRLDAVISADATRITASRDVNAPTNNANAIAISAMRTKAGTVSFLAIPSGPPETGSFAGFYRTMVTGIGVAVNGASDNATIYRSLTDQAESRRQSVSGVNTDEELTNMMRVQQAYTAASKLIKTADEMLQTLMQLV